MTTYYFQVSILSVEVVTSLKFLPISHSLRIQQQNENKKNHHLDECPGENIPTCLQFAYCGIATRNY